MKKPFEIWAKEEVLRLRSEADALERALVAYTLASIMPEKDAEQSASSNGGQHTQDEQGSRFSLILSAIENSPTGLTIDQLLDIVAKAGKPADRAVIRSQLWHRLKRGKLSKKGERYLIPKAKGPDAQASSPSH